MHHVKLTETFGTACHIRDILVDAQRLLIAMRTDFLVLPAAALLAISAAFADEQEAAEVEREATVSAPPPAAASVGDETQQGAQEGSTLQESGVDDTTVAQPAAPSAQASEPAADEAGVTAAQAATDPAAETATTSPTAAVEELVEPAEDRVENAKTDELEAVQTPVTGRAPFQFLGSTLAPGKTHRVTWNGAQSLAGLTQPTPVLVAHGEDPGPTLCLTAAIHGDELNGVEVVRRIIYDLEPDELAGTVVGIPIVNLYGFLRGSRYLPDRRDLNRFFPGSPSGSVASRVAYSLFHDVVRYCDILIDIHTGSLQRTNLPQLRADLSNDKVLALTKSFGATAVLHSEGPLGSLRRAATDAGISAVTLEAGEPFSFQLEDVDYGVKAIESVLDDLDMVDRLRLWRDPQPVFYDSQWVRAESSGILISRVKLGDRVDRGDELGTVTDPINNTRKRLRSPFSGRILGMALNQVVMPGFATFHIGRATSEREAVSAAELAEEAGEDGVEAVATPTADPEDEDG